MDTYQVIISIVQFVIFVALLVDIWRSPAGTGFKVGWTIFAFFCGLICLIAWFITGRKRAYGGAAAGPRV